MILRLVQAWLPGTIGVRAKSDADEQNEDGDLDERADDGREGNRRSEAESGDCDRDRQLEIIARRGEGDRGRARV